MPEFFLSELARCFNGAIFEDVISEKFCDMFRDCLLRRS